MEKLTIEITEAMVEATGVTVDFGADALLTYHGEELKGALLAHLRDEVRYILEQEVPA